MLIPDDQVIGKVISILGKDIYHDLLSPAMKNVGNGFGDITAAIRLFTLPFAATGDVAEVLHEKFKLFLQKTSQKVPEDKLVSPNSRISASIVQNVLWSFDDADICELYSNLLASAANCDKCQLAHPSFPHIIAQLNSLDVKILDRIHHEPLLPFMEVKNSLHDQFSLELPFPVMEPFSLIEGYEDDYPDVSASLNTLTQLGLIQKATAAVRPDEPDPYDAIYASEPFRSVRNFVTELNEQHLQIEHGSFDIIHGSFRATTLGTKFLSVCGADE